MRCPEMSATSYTVGTNRDKDSFSTYWNQPDGWLMLTGDHSAPGAIHENNPQNQASARFSASRRSGAIRRARMYHGPLPSSFLRLVAVLVFERKHVFEPKEHTGVLNGMKRDPSDQNPKAHCTDTLRCSTIWRLITI